MNSCRRCRVLRADHRWKAHVAGGIQALEITYNRKTDLWHVHTHIIVTGSYLPQPQLKAAWKLATGDSDIVDIRAVNDRSKAARYVARYVSKPLDVDTWPPHRIREYAEAMKGRRLLQPFGCAFKQDIDRDDDDAEAPETTHLCHTDRLINARDHGVEAAAHAIAILRRTGASMATIVLAPHQDDKQPPEPTPAEIAYAVEVCRIIGVTTDDELVTHRATFPVPPSQEPPPCEPPTCTSE